MHYKPMEDWLLQYGSKRHIAPPEWADLPEELQLQLENYAQDEAVNRALTLAKSGEIYSSDADAVGRLVSDMARVWMLDADAIRRIVEAFTDALPPPPGEEFDRTVVRLYRRRDSLNWQELKDLVDHEDFLHLVRTIVEYIQLNPKRNLAREDALQLLQKAYDDWVLHTPEEAIDELIHLLEKNDNHVAMQDVHGIFMKRNAINSAHAIELGMDLGVESANPKELIRFLERFFDLMSKRGEMAMHLEYDVLELPDEDMDDDEAVIITPAEDPEEEEAQESPGVPEAGEPVEETVADIIEEAERLIIEDEPQTESEETEEDPAVAETEPESVEEEDAVNETAESAEPAKEDEIEEDDDDEEEIAIEMVEEVEESELVIDEETEDESVEGTIEVEDAASFGQEEDDADETAQEDVEEENVEQDEEQPENEVELTGTVEEVTPTEEIEIDEFQDETESEEVTAELDSKPDDIVKIEIRPEEPMKREPVLPDFLASDTIIDHEDDKAIVGSWWEAQKKIYKEDKAKEAANSKGSIKAKTQANDKKSGFLFWKKK